MAKSDIFEIEVLNWEKHKGGLKKGHSYFMLSKRFFDDHKIATLTSLERLLFITLIARCADDYSTIIRPSHDQLATMCGLHRHDITRSLASLERNQLIRWVKLPSNRIEKKRIEEKGKEKKRNSVRGEGEKPKTEKAPPQPAIAVVPIGQILVGTYCEAYKARYGSNPVIRPQDAKALKNFGETVGELRARDLIAAYLRMNNSWFITKAHDLTTFIQNLNQVGNFIETGTITTLSDARSAEFGDSLKNQIKRLGGTS